MTKGISNKGERSEVPLYEAIRGRVARDDVKHPVTGEVLVKENELITDDIAQVIDAAGVESMRVRSPLTCDSPLGVCATCYGADLSKGAIVELGMAVGTIAAQSIGEPGTQLTMRTFHVGGVATAVEQVNEIKAGHTGTVRYYELRVVENAAGNNVALTKKGDVVVLDKDGEELERHNIPLGATVFIKEGESIKKGQRICSWDPFTIPIIVESAGRVRYADLVEGKTFKTERDRKGKKLKKTVIEHVGDLHPEIIIEDEQGDVVTFYPLPEKAVIEIDEGKKVKPGDLLAKTPREVAGSQDIVGGLPRVTELFEARKPKNPSVVAEVSGRVELGEKRRGRRTILVQPEGDGDPIEHLIPQGQQLKVRSGDYVKAGEPLVEGPLVPHDILRISGAEAVQQYLIDEIQRVYGSQNVTINDKHIETIVAQMMRKVRVIDEGDASEFLPEQVVDKFIFRAVNERVKDEGGKPAIAEPLLLGITKAALFSESFLSASSFQETTKVLTEAALAGKTDQLLGLKENIILGHIIPAGTGFKAYYQGVVKHNPSSPAFAHLQEPEGNGAAGGKDSARKSRASKSKATAAAATGDGATGNAE